jgi:hypothetical protein
MNILNECPNCGEIYIENFKIGCIENQVFINKKQAYNYILDNIYVMENFTRDDIWKTLWSIHDDLYDGILISDVRQILKNKYKIASISHIEVIFEIEKKLGFFCPDHKHLCKMKNECIL